MERGCRLADLPLEDFRSADASLDKSVYEVLGVERAVNAFKSYGSTAPAEVRQQIQRWKKALAGQSQS